MKFLHKFFIVIAMFCLSMNVWAFSFSLSDFQFGVYGKKDSAIGAVKEHEDGKAGIGADVFYQPQIPGLTDKQQMSFGVKASTDLLTSVHKQSYIKSWNVMNITGGIWLDLIFAPGVKFRPEFNYGVSMNYINAPERNVSGPYIDQIMNAGISLILEPPFINNLYFYGAMNYAFEPEKMNVGNYWGLRMGVMFKIPERNKPAAEAVVFDNPVEQNETETSAVEEVSEAADSEDNQ